MAKCGNGANAAKLVWNDMTGTKKNPGGCWREKHSHDDVVLFSRPFGIKKECLVGFNKGQKIVNYFNKPNANRKGLLLTVG